MPDRLYLRFVSRSGVKLRQSLPGLTEIAQAGVGIDRLETKRIIQSATNQIKDRFLGGSDRLLAVVQDHRGVLLRRFHEVVMGNHFGHEAQSVSLLCRDFVSRKGEFQGSGNPGDRDQSD